MLDERPLHGMQLSVGREPLDRRHLTALRLQREQRAALDRAAVDENGAGAALARVAADVRARQPQAVAQRVDEQRAPLDLERTLLAVDGERELRHPA